MLGLNQDARRYRHVYKLEELEALVSHPAESFVCILFLLALPFSSPFSSLFHRFAAYRTSIWSAPLGYKQWHPVVATPTFFSSNPPNCYSVRG